MNTLPLLTISNLSKEYVKGNKALSDINLTIQPGEFISIIGPSGAGKSTLLRCINRMVDASEGSIVFDNVEVTTLPKSKLKHLRRKIGMIFQHYNLVNRLSVMENTLHGRLGYTSAIAGMLGWFRPSERQQAADILGTLGLDDHITKRCDQLSGGQKQRVGIARALLQEPKLILCDEPIASLDPNASRVIMDYMRNINREHGITCLFNLHQVDVALKYSDRIIGINGGRILYDGKPSELDSHMIHQIYGSEVGSLITD